jgi:hypothetical protein
MACLVSLAHARMQLRLTDSQSEYDDELDLKRAQASALVMDYLEDYLADFGSPAPDWDENTDPSEDITFALVQAATLEVLTNLWRHRGDVAAEGPFTDRVVQCLRGLKVPPLG